MATKLLNIFIIFAFLFSITFFCVQSQINSHYQTNSSAPSQDAGAGDISTDLS